MKASPRFVAIEVLCLWQKTAQPVDQLFEQYLASLGSIDPRDRGLAFALIYGTLRWLGFLDWILARYCRHPLGKMKPRTLQALRIGLFQLLFMDRIPEAAAIDETINSLKLARQPKWLVGFVNGVLRNLARGRDELPSPWDEGSPMEAAARLSHPQWLLDRWLKRYGTKDAHEICNNNNLTAPLVLRINTRRTSMHGFVDILSSKNIASVPGSYAPEALYLIDYRGNIADLPGYDRGLFQVQDEGAQLISLLLTPLFPNRLYLDGCAGLGGKTSHLAQMLPPDSSGQLRQITAIEPNHERRRRLGENLHRLGLSQSVSIFDRELEKFSAHAASPFAGVLIDAPCSGLGVIRRHPDIRWNRKPEDLQQYQHMQLQLLTAAASLVENQGVLVYATCSTEPEENEDVINRFLSGHKEFILSCCADHLPKPAKDFVDGPGFFTTVPGRNGMDGFFAARLEKKT